MKNCANCKFLEYYEKDYEESGISGFCCNGRDYYKYGDAQKNEKKHLKQLQNKNYRNKSKVCFIKRGE